MKRKIYFIGILISFFLTIAVVGQTEESYTGTVVSFGTGLNTRTITRTFTLNIKGQTSDTQAKQFLDILQANGQDVLLKEISNQNLGYFSLGSNLGRTINVVREETVDDKQRIFIVFERWLQIAEIRGGYRSVDYPFSVIEMFIDQKTGRGDGTYIPAARIRWNVDKKTGQQQVEIENFATFPAKLLGINLRQRKNN